VSEERVKDEAVRTAPTVRELRAEDLDRVIEIDAQHTGRRKPDYWRRLFDDFVGGRGDVLRVGLAAELGGRVVGYLLGEVRAFEFGSEACGWVFAIGVDRGHLRGRIASTLLAAACRRFKDAGIECVRTMVRRNDVPVLSFFRANGFVGGSFVELELDLRDRT
jgi:ribosomal protein S18 acetylase RimI-like enzyme